MRQIERVGSKNNEIRELVSDHFFFFQVGETIRMEALIYILEFKKIIS